jgi:hypothetical protein
MSTAATHRDDRTVTSPPQVAIRDRRGGFILLPSRGAPPTCTKQHSSDPFDPLAQAANMASSATKPAHTACRSTESRRGLISGLEVWRTPREGAATPFPAR